MLTAQVADQQVKVNPAAGAFGGARVVFPVEVGKFATQKMDPIRVLGHIDEHALPAAHQGRALPHIRKTIDQGKLSMLTGLVASVE